MSRLIPSIRLALALLGTTLGACADDAEPPEPVEPLPRQVVPSAPQDDRVVLRPGSSLLDWVERMTVQEYPTSNLDRGSAVKALRHKVMLTGAVGPGGRAWSYAVQLETAAFRPEDWKSRPAPAQVRGKIAPGDPRRFYKAFVSLQTDQRKPSVQVARHDQIIPIWDFRQPELPPPGEDCFLWFPKAPGLWAFAEEPPPDIQLRYMADPGKIFGGLELCLPWDVAHPRGAKDPPDAPRLRRNVRQQHLSVDSLYLPAPGRVSLEVDSLEADELEVALGLTRQGYRFRDEVLRTEPALSDGVVLAIEIDAGEGPVRVLEQILGAPKSDALVERRVSLKRWRGQKVTLHLVSEPGPAGDNLSDYAFFGLLGLHGSGAPAPRRPHVVVLDLDTLRADRLGSYGYSRPTSPRMDAWAAREAVVYTDASATASWTLPSTASILTGLSCRQHGVVSQPRSLHEGLQPLARRLRDVGYETLAWTEGGFVRPEFGFDLGFHRFQVANWHEGNWQETVEYLRQRRSARPLFLFLQTYYVHAPYRWNEHFVDPAYDGVFRGADIPESVSRDIKSGSLQLDDADRQVISDVYDGLVRQLDDEVMDFLEQLDDALDHEPTMVIILSDHGEEFFEHGALAHGQSLYQELIHVPLMIRYPRDLTDGPLADRCDVPVSMLDVVPTILDVVGLPPDPILPGTSLWSADVPAERVLTMYQMQLGEGFRHGLWKYITSEPPRRLLTPALPMLFHLGEDPGEARDLFLQRRDLYPRFRDLLEAHREKYQRIAEERATEAQISSDVNEALEALGYLEGDDDPPCGPSDPSH